jgi:membrane-bound acyltransferase YfiQ involved in biofilm formation
MTKRLLLLNGLAALMVPIHHATAYGLQAMFEWTNRYRPVSVPNFDQMGSLPYYLIMISRQLDAFAIPAFFFVSGFFISFMSKGEKRKLTWSTVMPRIKVLLIPFLIWTVVRFTLLKRPPTGLPDFFQPYYFIVLLIQYYLLSLWIVPLASKNWKLVLLTTAVIQLGVESLRIIPFLGNESNSVNLLIQLTPLWFAPSRIFYFTLGVVAGLNWKPFKIWLARAKWYLLFVVLASAVLTLLEYAVLDQMNGPEWLGPNNPGYIRIIYASTFSLCFLAFEKVALPFEEELCYLGARSLGIYLVNVPVVFSIAVLLYRLAPSVLGLPFVYLGILILAGLSIPLMLMEIIRRSPVRSQYRLLFG